MRSMSQPPVLGVAVTAVRPEATRVLIADDDPFGLRMTTRVLSMRGFDCRIAQDGADLLDQAAATRPHVILLDAHMTPMSGLEVLARLQSDHRTALIPVICVTADKRSETVLELLTAGADDYVAKPFSPDELQARILVATRRRILLGGVSPLTGLPGNVLLTRAVQQRLDAEVQFALLHVDIDNFKPFNDHYGYVRGDEVIGTVAAIISRAADHVDAARTVLGHIGGDDFGVLTPVEHAHAMADEIVQQFDAVVPEFHDREDVDRGHMILPSRFDESPQFPLLSISIGVAIWTTAHPRSTKAVADIAAEMKGVAKRHRGSYVAVDERWDHQDDLADSL